MKAWFETFKNWIRFKSRRPKTQDILDIPPEEMPVFWGHFLVAEDQSRYLKIGKIILCIDHYNQEWKIACHSEIDKKHYPSKTFKVNSQAAEIIIKPALPDRPMLCQIETPIVLYGNSELTLYANTPCWIRIEMGSIPMILDEFPTQILADSWHGLNTLMGELCYSGPPVHFEADELLSDNTQAITPITLINPHKENIYLKELRIPLPLLSIYHDKQNHLWTEEVWMTFEDGENPFTSVAKKSSVKQKEHHLLSRSRHKIKRRFPKIFGS